MGLGGFLHPLLAPLLTPLLGLCCLASLGAGFPFGPSLGLDVTPRTTVLSEGLVGCPRFRGSVQNYSTLLLEEEEGVLYVGGRGAIYALDANNISTPGNLSISWEASSEQRRQCLSKGKNNETECFNHIRFLQRYNESHLYVCGTHAFRPLCAYIDVERFSFSSGFEEGRDRCPYDPAKGYTGLLIDGEMFTASQYEFRSSADIRRNFPFPTLRTEEAPTRWLLDADFVGSVLLKESINSSVGDDDKIYFFFREKSQEQTAYPSQTRVSRVARVCKGDWGGQRTLQKKWTSFLKARLVCSVPDYELHLNMLRAVSVRQEVEPSNSILYGAFGLEWKNIKASAVCQYSFSDIQKAFSGPYMEVQDSKWREYTGKVPEPRPGSCITDLHRSQSINSSRDLPDSVLTFARRHPLMSTQVQPIRGRPLMFKRNVNYVKMAVQQVPALDGQLYTVLFLGTDEGWLHKAVDVEGDMHIVEELQIFTPAQPIDSMVLSTIQKSIYVGAHSGVVQVPMATCRRYTSCLDCVFARDPYCGWDGTSCVEVSSGTDRSRLIQDIRTGSRGCDNSTGDVLQRRRSVMSGDDVLLQCELRSNLASPRWTLNGRPLNTLSPAHSPAHSPASGYRQGTDGLLIIGAQPHQGGAYRCFAVENNIWVPVRLYRVTVHTEMPSPGGPTATPSPAPPPSPSPAATPSTLTERLLPSPPAPLPPGPEFQTFRSMEAVYISLVAVLGGLCLVLTVVLLYVSFCSRRPHGAHKFPQQEFSILGMSDRKMSFPLELQTISSHCNGRQDRRGQRSLSVPNDDPEEGFLQIMPGEGQMSPSMTPAPPPLPPPLPCSDYANGLSATLPSVLRKMNGNSYMLLRAAEADSTSPLYHSFTQELNQILEKRKYTQPDESSV